ncbi:type III secretion system HrpP C-terminal domain-containing protein [Mixta gaviniae]|uniref:Type III secretion protein n=1 Tax=Mixta gaviniae TaxID=665914 RepID=A0A2L0IC68_9GAMM|nr:type III secretion system HrpP C-terminal domain-containing protein [Mixta gaviniae]AUX92201.1 hypothetical protein C2E15_03200 [Mixta gaviniae]
MNPFIAERPAAQPRPEPERREPRAQAEARSRAAPPPPPRAKPAPQPPTAAQAKPQSRGAERGRSERNPASGQSGAAKRGEQPESGTPDGMLFSALLDTPPALPPLSVSAAAFSTQPRFTPPAAAGASGAAPMALWQPLEAELGRVVDRQPDGPVAMTLLLPRLGEVDARLQPLTAGGWDIALRFSPTALGALEAHQERCRQALRRRMACRVRLRFEQRGQA